MCQYNQGSTPNCCLSVLGIQVISTFCISSFLPIFSPSGKKKYRKRFCLLAEQKNSPTVAALTALTGLFLCVCVCVDGVIDRWSVWWKPEISPRVLSCVGL